MPAPLPEVTIVTLVPGAPLLMATSPPAPLAKEMPALLTPGRIAPVSELTFKVLTDAEGKSVSLAMPLVWLPCAVATSLLTVTGSGPPCAGPVSRNVIKHSNGR